MNHVVHSTQMNNIVLSFLFFVFVHVNEVLGVVNVHVMMMILLMRWWIAGGLSHPMFCHALLLNPPTSNTPLCCNMGGWKRWEFEVGTS